MGCRRGVETAADDLTAGPEDAGLRLDAFLAARGAAPSRAAAQRLIERGDVTDPYLNLFRRFMPMVRMGPGALDLSPIVATIVLILVSALVTGAIRG